MVSPHGYLTLEEISSFCKTAADPRFLTIRFKFAGAEDIAGVAHKRTYTSSAEPFEADFYVEATDPSVIGIRVRPRGSRRFGGVLVREVLKATPPPSVSTGARLSLDDLTLQFGWEFDLLARSLDDVRRCF